MYPHILCSSAWQMRVEKIEEYFNIFWMSAKHVVQLVFFVQLSDTKFWSEYMHASLCLSIRLYTYYSQLIHFPVTFLHLLNSVFPLLQKILTFCMNLTEFFSCFIQLDLVIASKNCDVDLFWYQENEKFNDAVEKLYTTSIATNIIKKSYNV